jgi:hypothetical protein
MANDKWKIKRLRLTMQKQLPRQAARSHVARTPVSLHPDIVPRGRADDKSLLLSQAAGNAGLWATRDFHP